MANNLTNTHTSYALMPWADGPNDKTKHFVEVLQTICSGSTNGVLKVVATDSSDSVIIYALNGTYQSPSGAALANIHIGCNDLGQLAATQGVGWFSFNFGPFGLMYATTTTATVNFVASIATITATIVATIGRKK